MERRAYEQRYLCCALATYGEVLAGHQQRVDDMVQAHFACCGTEVAVNREPTGLRSVLPSVHLRLVIRQAVVLRRTPLAPRHPTPGPPAKRPSDIKQKTNIEVPAAADQVCTAVRNGGGVMRCSILHDNAPAVERRNTIEQDP